jgi:hypothetical protein
MDVVIPDPQASVLALTESKLNVPHGRRTLNVWKKKNEKSAALVRQALLAGQRSTRILRRQKER